MTSSSGFTFGFYYTQVQEEMRFCSYVFENIDKVALTLYRQKQGGAKLVVSINKALHKIIEAMPKKKSGFVF